MIDCLAYPFPCHQDQSNIRQVLHSQHPKWQRSWHLPPSAQGRQDIPHMSSFRSLRRYQTSGPMSGPINVTFKINCDTAHNMDYIHSRQGS